MQLPPMPGIGPILKIWPVTFLTLLGPKLRRRDNAFSRHLGAAPGISPLLMSASFFRLIQGRHGSGIEFSQDRHEILDTPVGNAPAVERLWESALLNSPLPVGTLERDQLQDIGKAQEPHAFQCGRRLGHGRTAAFDTAGLSATVKTVQELGGLSRSVFRSKIGHFCFLVKVAYWQPVGADAGKQKCPISVSDLKKKNL